MKILITGISGFVGRRLAEVSLKHGYEVVGVTRRDISNDELTCCANGNLYLERADLINGKNISDILFRWQPRVVFHTAARIPRSQDDSALVFFDDNVRSTLNVMHYSRLAGVKHVIFSSTMSVYGHPAYLPVNEKHLINPIHPYGLSKLEGEWYGRLYAGSNGMGVTVLRYSGIYGKGQGAGAIPGFIERCLKGEPIYLDSGGKPSSDFVWIDDVVQANLLSIDRAKSSFDVFNIGSGCELSIKNLAETIKELCNSDSQICLRNGSSPRNFRFVYDINKAKQQLGYSPTLSTVALQQYIMQLKGG